MACKKITFFCGKIKTTKRKRASKMIAQDNPTQNFKQYEYFHVPNYSGSLDIASDNGGAEYLASLANRPKGDPEVAGAKAEVLYQILRGICEQDQEGAEANINLLGEVLIIPYGNNHNRLREEILPLELGEPKRVFTEIKAEAGKLKAFLSAESLWEWRENAEALDKALSRLYQEGLYRHESVKNVPIYKALLVVSEAVSKAVARAAVIMSFADPQAAAGAAEDLRAGLRAVLAGEMSRGWLHADTGKDAAARSVLLGMGRESKENRDTGQISLYIPAVNAYGDFPFQDFSLSHFANLNDTHINEAQSAQISAAAEAGEPTLSILLDVLHEKRAHEEMAQVLLRKAAADVMLGREPKMMKRYLSNMLSPALIGAPEGKAEGNAFLRAISDMEGSAAFKEACQAVTDSLSEMIQEESGVSAGVAALCEQLKTVGVDSHRTVTKLRFVMVSIAHRPEGEKSWYYDAVADRLDRLGKIEDNHNFKQNVSLFFKQMKDEVERAMNFGPGEDIKGW